MNFVLCKARQEKLSPVLGRPLLVTIPSLVRPLCIMHTSVLNWAPSTQQDRWQSLFSMRSLNIHVLLFVCMFTAGAVQLFEKHYNRKIEGNITASIPVKGVLDCDKLCLGMDADCLAVNVIYTKHEYICDVMATFPYSDEELESQMISISKGKLIIFRGECWPGCNLCYIKYLFFVSDDHYIED